MIIISDLSYVEVVSASSIVGGASQVNSAEYSTTTSTDDSSVTTKGAFYLSPSNSTPTPLASKVFLVEHPIEALAL